MRSALTLIERIINTEARLLRYVDTCRDRIDVLESRMSDMERILLRRQGDEILATSRSSIPHATPRSQPESSEGLLVELVAGSTLSYEPDSAANTCSICLNPCVG